MTIEIPLTRGYVAIVDDCDADLLQYKWCARPHKQSAYAQREITVDGKQSNELMHRVILGRKLGRPLDQSELCDHINNVEADNRRENLRVATYQANARNRRAHANTLAGLKGVSFHAQTRKWRARICIDGKRIALGLYATPELAHAAYCASAAELFGEFANDGVRPLRLADAPVATRQLPLFPEAA